MDGAVKRDAVERYVAACAGEPVRDPFPRASDDAAAGLSDGVRAGGADHSGSCLRERDGVQVDESAVLGDELPGVALRIAEKIKAAAGNVGGNKPGVGDVRANVAVTADG